MIPWCCEDRAVIVGAKDLDRGGYPVFVGGLRRF